jgi:hypothetical protein
MCLKRIWALLFLVGVAIPAISQKDVEDQANWKDRIYTGGGLGFSGGTDGLGNRYFNFSVSPIVGYMVTSQLSAGMGVSYQRIAYPDFDFNYTQYGFMPFVRYNFSDFFLTAEYNYINLPRVSYNSNGYAESDRFFASRMLVGAGYSQPLGGRARVNAMAMYDLLYQRPSYFLSPWVFRVFVSF